ncbi:MAG TPA: kelch repeat-containing protein [Thermoplasmata archaeon]|nr:kelch repeat-containing protein [Thermoplasmata archaeon]
MPARIPIVAGTVTFVCLLLLVPSGLQTSAPASLREGPPLGPTEHSAGPSLAAPSATASPTFFGNWTRPNGNPASSYSSAMTYDSADGYELAYGGGVPSPYPFQPSTTWEYANRTWTPHDLSPSPSVVTGAGMAFDAKDGYVVLFGGMNSNATWTFSGGAWTEIFPRHSPIAGAGSDMVYDPASRAVILYAGHHTWSFAGGQWTDDTHYTKYTGPPTLPAGDSALAYDSLDHYAVLWSSWTSGSRSWNATWTFARGNWTNVSASAGPAPATRSNMVFVDDPADGFDLLFGGSGPISSLNDSWSFSGGRWTTLAPALAPPGSYGPAASFDTGTHSVLLRVGYPNRELWSFRASSWTELTVYSHVGPSARSGASLAGAVLFGGRDVAGAALGDTWEFENGFWFNLSGSLSIAPPARYNASMVEMAESGIVLLFGGTNGTSVFDDTWLFQNGAWRQLTILPVAPSGRWGSAITFAPPGTAVLFGGTDGTRSFNDTWNYTVAHGWSLVPTSHAPVGRWAAALVWHQLGVGSSELVLFGGKNRTASFRETWILAGAVWSRIAFSSPRNLPPVGVAAVGPNVVLHRANQPHLSQPFVAFGGRAGATISNFTFLFRNGNWSRLTAGIAPDARYDASASYGNWDSGNFLLFGGLNSTGPLGDTWEFYIPVLS